MSKNLRINNKHFVDETRKLSFTFNGKKLYGYKGDTLASALLYRRADANVSPL